MSVPREMPRAEARGLVELVEAVASRSAVPRLALSRIEAAESLGCSVDYLEKHVLPDVRVVRRGRLRLIPVKELQRWLELSAARAVE